MTLRPPIIRLLFSCLALSGTLVGQQPQIDQARQFQAGTNAPGVSVSPFAESSLTLDTGSDLGIDDESFGVQQMLREHERFRHFRVGAEISAFATDNVALSSVNRQSDSFLAALVPVEYRRPLGGGFQLHADLRFALFRYNRFQQLDFNSFDVGVGLDYHTEKLGGLDLFARYNYNQLNSARSGNTFFKNHTFTAGVQKSFVFSKAHYAYLGATGQLGFADPVESERSEASIYAGYHLQATRNLQVDLLYRYAWHEYSAGPRQDHNQTVAVAVRYRLADWASIFASSFASWNDSNVQAFDYEAANVGGGVTLSLQF